MDITEIGITIKNSSEKQRDQHADYRHILKYITQLECLLTLHMSVLIRNHLETCHITCAVITMPRMFNKGLCEIETPLQMCYVL